MAASDGGGQSENLLEKNLPFQKSLRTFMSYGKKSKYKTLTRNLKEVYSNPHRGIQDYSEQVTAEVVKKARKVELEMRPEDVTELLITLSQVRSCSG